MSQAKIMLAKAGFPDTKAGRAAFHKRYPTEESFFQVHGDQDNDRNIEPDGDSDDMYKAGGSIHIKPSHKGRFTAYKERTGKTTEEALHSKDPHVRQMANFARNAAKWKHEDGGVVDAYQLMGIPTPAMYGAGGPYIDDSMEGYNDGLANASPVFNPNPPQNNTPLKFVERKPANTVNYNVDYNKQALRLNAAYNHNFKSGINVGAQGNYNVNRIMPQESGSPIIKQNWDAAVNAGYTGRNSNISIGANYNPQEGVKGNIKGSWNFGAKHANGGNIFPTMYGFGSMVDGMDGEDPVTKGTLNQPRIVQEVPQGYTLVPGTRNTYSINTPGSSLVTRTPGNRTTTPRITNQVNRGNTGNTGNVVRQRQNPSVTPQSAPGSEDYVTLHENIEPIPPRPIQMNMDWDADMYRRRTLKHQPPSPPDTDGGGWFGGLFKSHYNNRRGQSGGKGRQHQNCSGERCPQFEDGGPTNYIPSYNFGHVQSADNTYNHGYDMGGDIYSQANDPNNWLVDPNVPMHANGGKVPMFGFGGDLFKGNTSKKMGNTLYDSGLTMLDTSLGVLGGQDIIGDKRYKGDTFFGDNSDTFTDLSHWTGSIGEAVAPTALSFIPGVGTIAANALSGLQAGVGALTPTDQDRINSKSGRAAALAGAGIAIAGGFLGNEAGAANAASTTAKVAESTAKAAKAAKIAADVGKGIKYAKTAKNIYDTAANPNATTEDWIGTGLGVMGTVGSGLGAGNATGDALTKASTAGRAGMGIYNTAQNIDKYGLNANTGLQAMNTIGSGLGAASSISGNEDLGKASKIYNTIGSGINYGANTYNAITAKPNDAYSYVSSIPAGVQTGLNFNNTFGKHEDPSQDPNAFTPSSLGLQAMGGYVNDPKMMKYATGGYPMLPRNASTGRAIVNRFADGGDAPNVTMGNVEKGELLLDDTGRIVTKYRGGGMVPHPADGSQDPNGDVPLKEGQFIIPKGYADRYESSRSNNDKLYADSIKNTVVINKAKKEEAKQQAEQVMQQKAMNAYGKFMAKYGGVVRQYGDGAGIYPNKIPYAQEQGEDWGYQPYNVTNLTGIDPEKYSSQAASTYNTAPIFGAGYNNPGASEYTGLDIINHGVNRGGSPPPPIETGMEGSPSYQYGNNPGVQAALAQQDRINAMKNSAWRSNYGSEQPSSKQPGYGMKGRSAKDYLAYLPSAALLAEGLLEKPYKMNAADYQVQGRVNPYEEQDVKDYRLYNSAMYNMRKRGGSDALAGMTQLYSAQQENFADQSRKVRNDNAARKMAADQANLGIEGTNKNMALQIAQFNEQNKAARRNAIREQGMNLFSTGYNQQANNMMKEQLSAAYPDHRFSWNTPKKQG